MPSKKSNSKNAKKSPAKKSPAKSADVKKSADEKETTLKRVTEKTPAEEILSKSLPEKQPVSPQPSRMDDFEKKVIEFNIKPTVLLKKLLAAVNKINPKALLPMLNCRRILENPWR